MTCRNAEDQLSAYLDGELSPVQAARLESHLQGCQRCSRELAELRSQDALLSVALGRPLPVPDAPVPLPLAPRIRSGGLSGVLRRARLGLTSAAVVTSCLALWVALRPATLHVERVSGFAAVVTAEGRHLAKVGETLKAGDQLATAAGQKIEVQWPDGTRVWLSPEGEATLLDGDRGMRLKRGRVWAHVAKQQTGFRVEGPAATAEVLGTQFQVRADAKGNTWLAVWQGRVRFFNKRGAVVATAWKQTGAHVGSAPAALGDYSPLGRDSLWWLE